MHRTTAVNELHGLAESFQQRHIRGYRPCVPSAKFPAANSLEWLCGLLLCKRFLTRVSISPNVNLAIPGE